MPDLYLRLIETTVALLLIALVRRVVSGIVVKRLVKAKFDQTRQKVTSKLLNITYVIVLVIILAGIWGLRGNQVLAFVTTALTILGIGFFAQWSLLSNITSGLILFFNHPLKLGDYIAIVDKDFPLEGQVEDIALFFLYIRDKEDRIFSIPNSIVMQKTFRIMEGADVTHFLEQKERILHEQPNNPSAPAQSTEVEDLKDHGIKG